MSPAPPLQVTAPYSPFLARLAVPAEVGSRPQALEWSGGSRPFTLNLPAKPSSSAGNAQVTVYPHSSLLQVPCVHRPGLPADWPTPREEPRVPPREPRARRRCRQSGPALTHPAAPARRAAGARGRTWRGSGGRGVRAGLRGPERRYPGSGKGGENRDRHGCAYTEVRLALESGSFPRAPPAATSPRVAANQHLGYREGRGPHRLPGLPVVPWGTRQRPQPVLSTGKFPKCEQN